MFRLQLILTGPSFIPNAGGDTGRERCDTVMCTDAPREDAYTSSSLCTAKGTQRVHEAGVHARRTFSWPSTPCRCCMHNSHFSQYIQRN